MLSKPRENNIKDISLIILIVIISSVVTFYCQYPLLINKYAVHDDVRQEVYMYLQFREPGLFQGDLITDYYRKWNPWGLTIFYFIVSLFYDPIQFTKILLFFLCGVSAFYMFMIGKLLKGNIVGFLVAFMFIFVAWSREIFEFFGPGGTADFGIPLFIMFVYYFLKKDFFKTGIFIILLSIFYPPFLVLSLSIYTLSLVSDFFKARKIECKKLSIFIISGVIILVLIWLKYFTGNIEVFSLKEMKLMEEFYPGGRKPIFFPYFFEKLNNPESGFAIDYPVKWLFFVCLVISLLLRKKLQRIPDFFWLFLCASFALYLLSNAIMYKLYAPARFMRLPLPFFLIIFIALNINKLFEEIKSKKKRLIFLLSFVFFIAISFAPKLQRHYTIVPLPNLYNFLQTLPKDVIIAGHPTIMDNITTFAKRKAFVYEEISIPYHRRFYPAVKNRTYQFFKAYYTDSLEEILEFCKRHNITHLVVYKPHFSQDYLNKKQFYLNPFNEYIKKLVKDKTRFALMEIPDDKKIFKDNDIFVVAVKDIFTQE